MGKKKRFVKGFDRFILDPFTDLLQIWISDGLCVKMKLAFWKGIKRCFDAAFGNLHMLNNLFWMFFFFFLDLRALSAYHIFIKYACIQPCKWCETWCNLFASCSDVNFARKTCTFPRLDCWLLKRFLLTAQIFGVILVLGEVVLHILQLLMGINDF